MRVEKELPFMIIGSLILFDVKKKLTHTKAHIILIMTFKV